MTVLANCNFEDYSKPMTTPKLRIIKSQRDALERTLEQKLVKALFSPDETEIANITAQLEVLAKKQHALKMVDSSYKSCTHQMLQASQEDV